MYVQAGKLDKEVTIESNSRATASATGFRGDSWSTFATVYASIKNTRGTEVLQAGEKAGRIDTLITIRYVTGIRTNMRVKATVQGGNVRYYNIDYVNNILEDDRMIELLCSRFEDQTNG